LPRIPDERSRLSLLKQNAADTGQQARRQGSPPMQVDRAGMPVGNFPGNFGSTATVVMSNTTSNLFEQVSPPVASNSLS